MNSEDFEFTPTEAVVRTQTYRPPRSLTPFDLKLDANEGPRPSAKLLEAVLRAGEESLRRYPNAGFLERQIGELFGIEPEKIIVTAGGDDAIERIMRASLSAGREFILPVPTFEMFPRYAALMGCKTVEIPWMREAFPTDEILRAVSPRTSLIAVVAPNSPTGFTASAEDLIRLSKEAPRALLLVDLAYAEFADCDLTKAALKLPNAVVVRSFSKAWGLAGLRLGWAASSKPQIIEWLRAVGHPYAVSAPSLVMASERLSEGLAPVKEIASRIRREREDLARLLEGLNAKVFKSQANFLLARFKNGAWMREALLGMGISARIFPDNPTLKNCLRITLPGCEADFERLKAAFETVLKPEALLFDMDDTIADVSGSYRLAIIETAAHFGARVTNADIAEAKSKGGANDEWALTRRLLSERGIEIALEEVTNKFEEFYQGTEGRDGFYKQEKLLAPRNFFERLKERYKLAVVTGRPKKDAEKFIADHSLEGLFETIVTAEEAPLKPSPEPVRLAMKRLGVKRAWMIGDTPDDIRAARAAVALPLGVTPPSDDPERVNPFMLSAGAGRVFSNIQEIEEVLP